MEVVYRIQQMLNEGKETEARELYFAELAPMLDSFRGALDELWDHETKQLDHDVMWRKIRLSFDDLNRQGEDAAEAAP